MLGAIIVNKGELNKEVYKYAIGGPDVQLLEKFLIPCQCVIFLLMLDS